jgi:hypothetical protein
MMDFALRGTWTLDVDQSVVEPGPIVRSERRRYDAVGPDEIKLFVEGTDATGVAYSYCATGRVDGTDCPMIGTGTRNGADSTSWLQIDPYTFDSVVKKAGKVVNRARLEVSVDGNVLIIREHGTNREGIATRGVRKYDKQ